MTTIAKNEDGLNKLNILDDIYESIGKIPPVETTKVVEIQKEVPIYNERVKKVPSKDEKVKIAKSVETITKTKRIIRYIPKIQIIERIVEKPIEHIIEVPVYVPTDKLEDLSSRYFALEFCKREFLRQAEFWYVRHSNRIGDAYIKDYDTLVETYKDGDVENEEKFDSLDQTIQRELRRWGWDVRKYNREEVVEKRRPKKTDYPELVLKQYKPIPGVLHQADLNKENVIYV